MKEYIEREAAIELGKKQSCAGIIDGGDFCNISANMLRKIPAADVVEVVRCHECVHHVGCGYYFCNMWCANCPDDSDFFCAYGERDGGVKDAVD